MPITGTFAWADALPASPPNARRVASSDPINVPNQPVPTLRSSPEPAFARGNLPIGKIPRNSKRLVPDIGVGGNGFSRPVGMWRPVAPSLPSQQVRGLREQLGQGC